MTSGRTKVLQLLKLHSQLFWYMHPCCVTWKASQCRFQTDRKQWRIGLWYFGISNVALSSYLMLQKGHPIEILTSTVTASTCVSLNCAVWLQKHDIVEGLNSLMRATRSLPYRISSTSAFAGSNGLCAGAGQTIIGYAETGIFLLSSLNPGFALIIISLDEDPFFPLAQKYSFGIASSFIIVCLRFILTNLLISEITRTFSFVTVVFTAFVNELDHFYKSRLTILRNESKDSCTRAVIRIQNYSIFNRLKYVITRFGFIINLSVNFIFLTALPLCMKTNRIWRAPNTCNIGAYCFPKHSTPCVSAVFLMLIFYFIAGVVIFLTDFTSLIGHHLYNNLTKSAILRKHCSQNRLMHSTRNIPLKSCMPASHLILKLLLPFHETVLKTLLISQILQQ